MAENNGKDAHYVGVDLGGTKILAGVFDPSMECLARVDSAPTERGQDQSHRPGRPLRQDAPSTDMTSP
jgi:predicted NBD/HSP70 family sugar kinase